MFKTNTDDTYWTDGKAEHTSDREYKTIYGFK